MAKFVLRSAVGGSRLRSATPATLRSAGTSVTPLGSVLGLGTFAGELYDVNEQGAEGGVAGWAGFNATITQSQDIPALGGRYVAKVVATANFGGLAGPRWFACVPGDKFQVKFWMWPTVLRDGTIGIQHDWLNASLGYVTTTYEGFTVSAAAVGQWCPIWGTPVAPAGAAFCSSKVFIGNALAGDTFYADGVKAFKVSSGIPGGSLPSTLLIRGTGTVQTPVEKVVTPLAAVSGTGTVQAPSVITNVNATPTPATVTGTGTVQAPVVALVGSPQVGAFHFIGGVGTVYTPAEATVLTTITGTGTVQGPAPIEIANPGAELGTTGWSNIVGSFAALTQSSAQAHSGAFSFLHTKNTSTSDMGIQTPTGTSGFVATPGKSYAISGWFRAGTTGRTCKVGVNWYDSGGGALTQVRSAGVTDSSSGWTQETVTTTAPATAAYGQFFFIVIAVPSGELHYYDDASVVEALTPSLTGLPVVVGGAGTVQAPVGVAVVKPTVVSGTGTVQTPAEVDRPTPPNVTGTGTVNTPTIVVVATPAAVLGTGTVWGYSQPAIITGDESNFDTSTGGWTEPDSYTTLTRDTGTFHDGSGALKAHFDFDSGGALIRSQTHTVAASTSYTLSAWVRVSRAQDVFLAYKGSGVFPTTMGAAFSLPANTWVFLSRTFTANVAGQGTTPKFGVYSADGLTGDNIWIDTVDLHLANAIVVAQGLPATVAGTGVVQAPTIVLVAKPTVLSGTGTTYTPAEAAVMAVVNGTGTVFTPTVITAVNATATPSVVSGTGTVQSPVGVATALPAGYTGTGTVQVPAESPSSLPAAVGGTGVVQVPVGVVAAKPSNVSGVGTVQAPAGVEVAFPSTVAGTGTVQSPVIVLAAKPTNVVGTGTIFTPAEAEVVNTINGIGTVQAAVVVLAALPSAVSGVGTVQSPVGVDKATPANVAGVGTVQSAVIALRALPPNATGTGTVFTPAEAAVAGNVSGIGTVQAVIIALAAKPAVVAGTGIVQSPVGAESGVPAVINGTGTVQAVVVVLVAKPAVVAGTGTIFAPAEAETPSTVTGTGTVQSVVVALAARPAGVAGDGTVFTPSVGGSINVAIDAIEALGSVITPRVALTAFQSAVLGTGTAQPPVDVDRSTPSNISGVGTVQIVAGALATRPTTVAGLGAVQSPVTLIVALPSNVNGVGTVNTPAIQAGSGSTASPATVAGVGTIGSVVAALAGLPSGVAGTGNVFSTAGSLADAVSVIAGAGFVGVIVIGLTALPVGALGTGTVFDVSIPAEEQITPAAIIGIGQVGSPVLYLVAAPQPVLGVGTVFAPAPLEALAFIVAAIIIAVSKREQTIRVSGRSQCIDVTSRDMSAAVEDRAQSVQATGRDEIVNANDGVMSHE